MRPVNKGDSPYKAISDYSEALPYLEKQIGMYCSYCELRIDHVPEVEHIVSKSEGGDRTAWENLLLGCKYCNSRKSNHTTPYNKDEYLWPDTDNTAIAFSYDRGFPCVNEQAAMQVDPSGEFLKKAKRLFELVKLNNIPKKGEKDRRYKKRNEVYGTARRTLTDWESMKGKENEYTEIVLRSMVESAKYSGFFSVWATVFKHDSVVLRALIDVFPGTEVAFFDENGQPMPISKKP